MASIILHATLLLVLAAWVVNHISDVPKDEPATFSPGGGKPRGGEARTSDSAAVAKASRGTLRNAARITTTAPGARVTISESTPGLGIAGFDEGLSALMERGLRKGGLGGTGGLGGPGLSGKNWVSPFGAMSGAGLRGVFYDIKQTDLMRPTRAAVEAGGLGHYRAAIRDFISGGWNERAFEGFYRAPSTLVMSQLFIPGRPAGAAPEAFGVEKDVRPSRWVVHYKGRVRAPQTGTFRFVGSGDDWLIVRWNRKVAFDEGYETFAVKDGDYRDFGQRVDLRVPIDRAPGGRGYLKAGPWISVRKGESIPVEILMGEGPGGVFDAYLAIEVAKPGRTKGDIIGEGSLKLFRTSHGALPEEIQDPGRGLSIDMQAEGWVFEAGK